MKKILFLVLGILIAVLAFADESQYEKAMKKSLELLDEAKGMDDFQEASNTFMRIADAEISKWLPAYYASYTMTVIAANEPDGKLKDEKLDIAQEYLDRASGLENDASEILALQGFIYMIRIGVDPATRGQTYSGKSAQALQKAKSINPQNPRALFMLAQLSFGTAQFFGSDTSEACNMNENALAQFDVEQDGNDKFAPKWGRGQAEQFKTNCNK